MFRKVNLLRRGQSYACEVLKEAHLSTGYDVYLLRRDYNKPVLKPMVGEFFVGCRDANEVKDFYRCCGLKSAIEYYLNLLCCYA